MTTRLDAAARRYRGPARLYLVDNASNDRTAAKAERALAAWVVADGFARTGLALPGPPLPGLALPELAQPGLAQIDVTQTDLEDAKARVKRKLRQRPQVMAVSAKTGRGLKRLVAEALSLADRSAQWIPTPELNRFVADLQSIREPPAVRGKRLRIYYMNQFETKPPRFAVHVNNRGLVVRDYAYFLENRLRERYRLERVPLVIDFKTSSGR